MEQFVHTDDNSGRWEVIDFRTVAGRTPRAPRNSRHAEARAFDSLDSCEIHVYKSLWTYHCTEPKILANELHFSKPLHASAAERMTGG